MTQILEIAVSDHSISFIPGATVMHRLYPLTKVGWLLVVATGLFFYRSPLSGAITFIVVITQTLLVARIPLRHVIRSSWVIFGLGLILMFFHFFADPGEPVYQLGPLTITDTGLAEGPIYFFRLSVIVLASFLLIWTTDIRDLMIALTKAGMPYRFAYTVFLSLRFLPLIQSEVDAVKAAHAIRGQASRSGLLNRFRLWQRYIFTVLINGLRKAEAAATALECRGFDAFPTRTFVRSLEFDPKGLFIIPLFAVLVGGLIVFERLT